MTQLVWDEVEEHVAAPGLSVAEDYVPEIQIYDSAREADFADVSDQYTEIPEFAEDELVMDQGSIQCWPARILATWIG